VSARAALPPAFALIHGGHHGAWCWERLLPCLKRSAVCVQLPGTAERLSNWLDLTLEDWCASAAEQLSEFSQVPLILVGHSLGGITTTELARRMPSRIRHLVYISALVPGEGESIADLLGRHGRANLFAPSGEFPVLPKTACRDVLGNDMDDATFEWTYERLRAEPPGPLTATVTYRGLPAAPRTYVRLLRDNAISWELQTEMVTNLGPATAQVVLDSGHDVMLTHPRELGDLLNGLA
jgi:pimeloyl-ACP methyl ester carboxylesterase